MKKYAKRIERNEVNPHIRYDGLSSGLILDPLQEERFGKTLWTLCLYWRTETIVSCDAQGKRIWRQIKLMERAWNMNCPSRLHKPLSVWWRFIQNPFLTGMDWRIDSYKRPWVKNWLSLERRGLSLKTLFKGNVIIISPHWRSAISLLSIRNVSCPYSLIPNRSP